MKITIEFDNADVMDQDDIFIFGRFDEELIDDEMNPNPYIRQKKNRVIIPLKMSKQDDREEKKIRREDEHIRHLCNMSDDEFNKYLYKLHNIHEWRKNRIGECE